jgi:hypothetical protein
MKKFGVEMVSNVITCIQYFVNICHLVQKLKGKVHRYYRHLRSLPLSKRKISKHNNNNNNTFIRFKNMLLRLANFCTALVWKGLPPLGRILILTVSRVDCCIKCLPRNVGISLKEPHATTKETGANHNHRTSINKYVS